MVMTDEERALKRKEHNRKGIAKWRKKRTAMGLKAIHNMYIIPEYEPLYVAVHRWTQDDGRNFQSLINELLVINSQLPKK